MIHNIVITGSSLDDNQSRNNLILVRLGYENQRWLGINEIIDNDGCLKLLIRKILILRCHSPDTSFQNMGAPLSYPFHLHIGCLIRLQDSVILGRLEDYVITREINTVLACRPRSLIDYPGSHRNFLTFQN